MGAKGIVIEIADGLLAVIAYQSLLFRDEPQTVLAVLYHLADTDNVCNSSSYLMCLMGIGGVQKAYAVKQIYALKDGDRMTLYYDENKGNYPNNPLYQWNNTSLGAEGIDQNVLDEITTVIFHSSMKDARPVSTQRWFQDLRNLDAIYFLDYLNTSEVTDMSHMFYNCKSLNTLDVSKFNTDKVKTMSGMFFGCESLWTLDVSKFNTSNVEKMGWMFDGCSSLESLDVTKFNTENVTWMNFMFAECYSLTELDLTKFNTENVIYMNNMFEGDSSLTTIYCNRDWSASTVLESTFAHSLNSRGINTLVVEMGVGMRITKEYGDQLAEGIFSLMFQLGIWKEETHPDHNPIVCNNGSGHDVYYLNADVSGVFMKEKTHGAMIDKDEIIGVIVNPLTGDLLSTIKAPVNGWLFTVREYPVVDEGSLLGRILCSEALG